jgi:hypothetical protein
VGCHWLCQCRTSSVLCPFRSHRYHPVDDGDSEFAPVMLWGGVVGVGPSQLGQPVLEASFPTAFPRLDTREGDRRVSPPGHQAKRRTIGPVVHCEGFVVCAKELPHGTFHEKHRLYGDFLAVLSSLSWRSLSTGGKALAGSGSDLYTAVEIMGRATHSENSWGGSTT